ncbi:MAG: hypothetical protein ACPHID_03315 [Thermoplasmatota archaeon]
MSYRLVWSDDVPGTLATYQDRFPHGQSHLHPSRQYAELDAGDHFISVAATDMRRRGRT